MVIDGCSTQMSEEQRLPASWRAAIAHCPYCSGTGKSTDALKCLHCEGSGDLFASMLLSAYAQGRESVLWQLRSIDRHTAQAVAYTAESDVTARELKRSMGL